MTRHRPTRRPAQPRANSDTGRILELNIGEPAHGGACVARDEDGRVIFVRHALPGEKVRARITATRKKLAWADAIDILEPSPDRIPIVWQSAGPGGVGGAELAHVRPAAQREWKKTVIDTQLRRVGGISLYEHISALGGVNVEAAPGDNTPTDPLLGRRTRIEMVIDENNRPAMHQYRGSHLTPLRDMPLAVPAIDALHLFDEDTPWMDIWTPGDRIRAVAPNGENPVLLINDHLYDASTTPLDADTLQWTVTNTAGHNTYRVRPSGFWQTHLRGADILTQAVLDAATAQPLEGAKIIELYSGAGLFTLPLAQQIGNNGRILTLEGDEDAVRDAGNNTAPYPQADTYAGNVDDESILELSAQLGDTPDLILLDPPRAGAGANVCHAIANLDAPRIILISCDPAAGARDLRTLTENGYHPTSLKAWDLFPHTHHVEMVTALERN